MKKTATFFEDGEKFIIEAEFNFEGYFSLTADLYRKARNGRKVFVSCGCLHDEIKKHFPSFAQFINLHCCDINGLPVHTVANGFYTLQTKGLEGCSDFLGVRPQDATMLQSAEDEKRFSYLLEESGILETRRAAADQGLKFLGLNRETITGAESYFTPLTSEERTELETREQSGYYVPAAIEARRLAKAQEEKAQKRMKLCSRYDEEVEKALTEKAIILAVFDYGIDPDNVIFYNHSRELCFNWLDYKPRISEQEYNDFCEWAHKQPIFFGINFSRKNK